MSFLTRMFQSIGRGITLAVNAVLSPFRWVGGWLARRGGIVKTVLGLLLILLVVLYGYFFWITQRWTNFNPDYVKTYERRDGSAAQAPAPPAGGIVSTEDEAAAAGAGTQTCRRSLVVDATGDLVDFNVNQNAWISSMVLYKLGLFGLPWDRTPFFDNKAAFQRGVHQAIRRTSIELVDTLGRVRGTSQIDTDLQSARGNLQFDESTWYFAFSPFGPKTPTPSFYRAAIKDLKAFNERRENARRCSTHAPTICCNSSTASRTISAQLRRSCATARRSTIATGSTRAPTTASGSPTGNSTAITASSRLRMQTSRM